MESAWDRVDEYFNEHVAPSDDVLAETLSTSAAAGLPPISVTPTQGKLLHLLVQACGARRVLEIGTLGGYSAIWMGRALPPDGRLVTLEIDRGHAAVAQRNIDRAGLTDRVEILVAPAVESLSTLAAERADPFDFVFIDADKPNSDVYFKAAVGLSRPGTLIIVDNVVRNGDVIDAAGSDANVQGIRRLVAHLANDPRVSATALQTVGSKGYDGFILARVTQR